MRRETRILAAVALVVLGAGHVEAGTIAGPSSFGSVGGNDTLWGIQFTALDNSTLTGFDYNHNPTTFGNPFTGTISVIDVTTSSTVYSDSYVSGSPNPIVFSGLNIGLVSGDVYQLVATSDIVSNANDEVFQYISLNSPPITYPTSDADISVTQGVFNNNPGFQESNAWGAFTNITTASAVPEPASILLLGVGFGGLAVYARRQRNRLVA